MKSQDQNLRFYFSILLLIVTMVASGCGYTWRIWEPIQSDRVNHDEPVTTMTVPNQVKSEKVLFAYETQPGLIVVTMTREAETFDLKTDTVNRQVYEENGYGKDHDRWPVWVDAVTGSVLAIGGGAAIAAGASQSSKNDYEYRTNPDTGQRERREVPNSSNRDAFYASGGAAVGVSIPFLVSAIHNGVRTRSHDVGAPQRVTIPHELNQRTVRSTAANLKVTITLPSGASYEATTDQAGKLALQLADRPDDYFPLQYLAVVTVPSKEARYEIPAGPETLASLPAAAKARADAMAEDVTRTRGHHETVRARLDEAAAGPLADMRRVDATNREYWITGDIIETKPNFIIVKGYAQSDRGGEGDASDSYLAVFNYDQGMASRFSYKHYQGHHYFRERVFEKLYLMQSGPIMVYGDLPEDQQKRREAAQRQLASVQTKYGPPVEQAKRESDSAWSTYIAALPTDPYGLKNQSETRPKNTASTPSPASSQPSLDAKFVGIWEKRQQVKSPQCSSPDSSVVTSYEIRADGTASFLVQAICGGKPVSGSGMQMQTNGTWKVVGEGKIVFNNPVSKVEPMTYLILKSGKLCEENNKTCFAKKK